MIRNSELTLAGQRQFHVSRPAVTPRGSLRRLFEVVKQALPFVGNADAAINRYRAKNVVNVWRGFWRIAIAVMCRIPTYYGAVYATVIRGDGRIEEYGLVSLRVVTTTGVNNLVDCFQNLAEPENFRYHGFGTGTGAEAAGDTALGTEETTQYNPNSTRPTGSQTEGASANIYRSVATYTPDSGGVRPITEHGIFSQAATGGGVLLDRSVFAAFNLDSANGDSLQITYDLTLPSGS